MADALAVTTLTNIPPDRYERIQQAAEEQIGAALVGNDGTASDKGCVIEYHYTGGSLLTISVLKVPSIFGHEIISPQAVIAKIEKAIQGIA